MPTKSNGNLWESIDIQGFIVGNVRQISGMINGLGDVGVCRLIYIVHQTFQIIFLHIPFKDHYNIVIIAITIFKSVNNRLL